MIKLISGKFFAFIFASLLLLSLVFNSHLYAQTTTAPTVKLPQMSAGSNVDITNPVDSDLFVAGEQVDVDTSVSGDVYAAGRQVNLKGIIDGDLIVAGGEVNISGEVRGNLIMAGGKVNLANTAVISGYILGAGNDVTLAGVSNGPARLAGSNVTLTNNAQVGGDLEVYTNQANIDPAAQIQGQRRISETPENQRQNQNWTPGQFADEFSAFNLFLFLAQALVLLVLLRLLSNRTQNLLDPAFDSPLAVFGWGLVRLLIIPFLILLLFFTVIGIPLGLLATVIYGIGLYLATLVSGLVLGRWLYQKKWINNDSIYLQGLIGYLILFIIGFIPFIGPLIKFVAFLFGLGFIFVWEKSLFAKKPGLIKT